MHVISHTTLTRKDQGTHLHTRQNILQLSRRDRRQRLTNHIRRLLARRNVLPRRKEVHVHSSRRRWEPRPRNVHSHPRSRRRESPATWRTELTWTAAHGTAGTGVGVSGCGTASVTRLVWLVCGQFDAQVAPVDDYFLEVPNGAERCLVVFWGR